MITLFAFRDSKLWGVAHLVTESKSVSVQEGMPLTGLLTKLLGSDVDFRQAVGFPSRIVSAPARSIPAFQACSNYLRVNHGCATVLMDMSTTSTSSSAVIDEIESREIASSWREALGVLVQIPPRVESAADTFEAITLKRRQDAARFGCMKEFQRKERWAQRKLRKLRAPARSLFNVVPSASAESLPRERGREQWTPAVSGGGRSVTVPTAHQQFAYPVSQLESINA